MFDIVKAGVSLLDAIAKDLDVPFKPVGTEVYGISDELENGGCPFCGHKDCFRVKHVEGLSESDFYKCYSCGVFGDVINWAQKRHGLTAVEAAKKLAKDFGISIDKKITPVQSIFNLAAGYYKTALWETANKPSARLAGLTPLQYQTTKRKHSESSIKKFNVGWSNGTLTDFLVGFDYDEELLVKSGLVVKRADGSLGDFLPSDCFIYPHYVDGQVSHFTFKDPLKKLSYQLPNKYVLNGYRFYNQDSVKRFEIVIIVEGENDVISVASQAEGKYAVIGTIGQISREQLTWLDANCSNKNIVTIFDPDDGGDTYRKALAGIRSSFKHILQVLPPEGKDIDELIVNGGDLEQIVNDNQVEVKNEKSTPIQRIKFDSPDEGSGLDNKQVKTDISVDDARQEASVERSPLPVDMFRSESTNDKKKSIEKSPRNEFPPDEDAERHGANLQPNNANSIQSVAETVTLSGQGRTQPDSEVAEVSETSYTGNIFEKHGAYWRVKLGKSQEDNSYSKISNFTLELKCVYITESKERIREVIVHKENGYKSEPIWINSSDKVILREFRKKLAEAADADFTGTDADLSSMWELVYSKSNERIVEMVRMTGRVDSKRCWIFRNKLITDAGYEVDADENGVFWLQGKSHGIASEQLRANKSDTREDMPYLNDELSPEEVDLLLGEFIKNLAENTGDLGKTLTMVGWAQACSYSNTVFKAMRGFPFLYLLGSKGKGKGTIMSWLVALYGLTDDIGKTAIPQINSGVSLSRRVSYYSSLPFGIDELRANSETEAYMSTFRAYYDRIAKIVGTKDSSLSITETPVRSCFIFGGEDVFKDPATRERSVVIELTDQNKREMNGSFEWMQMRLNDFSAIGRKWILESSKADHKQFSRELKSTMDVIKKIIPGEVRKSFVWSVPVLFANKLARQYFPDFDYMAYINKACSADLVDQNGESIIHRFFEMAEVIVSQNNPNKKLSNHHYKVDDNLLHIRLTIMYHIVLNEFKSSDKFGFSVNALSTMIKEQPYFVKSGESNKIDFNIPGDSNWKAAFTLDLNKCPEVIRSFAGYGGGSSSIPVQAASVTVENSPRYIV